ncbi:MAG: DUF1223 domain-containing protein [Proteobacteria bacterium]|nr:DUF1223 domain-containing protein [Burkholderiales bacterium]
MKRSMVAALPLLLVALTGSALAASSPGRCTADSGARRVALLELYTSQGCSSCPPTDRWVSELPGRGFGTDRLIVLAFHVDYWNRLGWRDPFSQAAFTERQREISTRRRAGYVYTPQLVLDGRDNPRRAWTEDFPGRVAEINRAPAQAKITLETSRGPNGMQVRADTRVTGSALSAASSLRSFVALYENGITTGVKSGENGGQTLRNDFIVRAMSAPGSVGSAAEAGSVALNFNLPADVRSERLVAVGFVQNIVTGEVLQAVALPACTAG